jgi:hypothetical protein
MHQNRSFLKESKNAKSLLRVNMLGGLSTDLVLSRKTTP